MGILVYYFYFYSKSQVAALYSQTKEKNSMLKTTLEHAESGAKYLATTATPVMEHFDKPSKLRR